MTTPLSDGGICHQSFGLPVDEPPAVVPPPGAPITDTSLGQLPLDRSQYPDPRPRLHRLTGNRCGAGIPTRNGGGLPSVNVNHIAREFVVVAILRHRHTSPGALLLPGALCF